VATSLRLRDGRSWLGAAVVVPIWLVLRALCEARRGWVSTERVPTTGIDRVARGEIIGGSSRAACFSLGVWAADAEIAGLAVDLWDSVEPETGDSASRRCPWRGEARPGAGFIVLVLTKLIFILFFTLQEGYFLTNLEKVIQEKFCDNFRFTK
jgi:hypothetical protein